MSSIVIDQQPKHTQHLYLDEVGYVLNHKNLSLRQQISALFVNEEKVELQGKSLLCLSSQHSWRRKCSWLVEQPFFEFFVLLTICFSSFVLILDEPGLANDPDSSLARFLYVSEIISTIIFIIEAVLKIIAKGLFFTPTGYFKDRWNILDFAVIVFSLLDFVIGHLSFLRVIRTFRALRIIRRIEGMRVVTIAMIQSIKPVMNVIYVSVLFFFVFGILGVQIFKGRFKFCHGFNSECEADCDSFYHLDKAECEATPGATWKNPAYGDFDHIGNALELLFQIFTLEMWPNIMYRAVDVTEVDKAPLRDNNKQYALYFILFIVIANFFIMNLFVGVVVHNV